MSIDARIETVIINEDGTGELRLIDRPPSSPGQNPGCAGQRSLAFDAAPEEVTALNGLDVWSGSGGLMLGDVEIAKRKGYTGIVFVDREAFNVALAKYRTRRVKT